jgi:Protein of unknown function (DUF2735)
VKTGSKNREITTLNNDHHQHTAKIYQFRPRTRQNSERQGKGLDVASAHYLSKITAPIYSGAWYHDAAIKEDDRKR